MAACVTSRKNRQTDKFRAFWGHFAPLTPLFFPGMDHYQKVYFLIVHICAIRLTGSSKGGRGRRRCLWAKARLKEPSGTRLFPQSSLDFFHVHREPSRLKNPSVIQNETSFLPSPCGRLSRPPTTMEVPTPSRLIGEDSTVSRRPIRVIAILDWGSLVPLLALKRFRLDFDPCAPNSVLLLLQAPADN